MNKWFQVACMAGALALAPTAFAKEAAAGAAAAAVLGVVTGTETVEGATAGAEAAATSAAADAVAAGGDMLQVNTGNELVDAVANQAVKCAERGAALKTCDTMGGFKAMACRKVAEMRYKDLVCSL